MRLSCANRLNRRDTAARLEASLQEAQGAVEQSPEPLQQRLGGALRAAVRDSCAGSRPAKSSPSVGKSQKIMSQTVFSGKKTSQIKLLLRIKKGNKRRNRNRKSSSFLSKKDWAWEGAGQGALVVTSSSLLICLRRA